MVLIKQILFLCLSIEKQHTQRNDPAERFVECIHICLYDGIRHGYRFSSWDGNLAAGRLSVNVAVVNNTQLQQDAKHIIREYSLSLNHAANWCWDVKIKTNRIVKGQYAYISNQPYNSAARFS